MKKIIILMGVLMISGCSLNGTYNKGYVEKEAEVIRSTYVDEFCMDTSNLDMLTHYHKDIKERGFFNSYPDITLVPDYKKMDYECRKNAYKTKVMLLEKDLSGSRYVEVMTKDRYNKGDKIKIMKKL